ncbi:MAG: homoserine kinase [Chthoniobacterales bacterium]
MPKSVTVRVPGTTSNLGPGFDCLGIALQMYNFIRVTKSETGIPDAMIEKSATSFFKAAKIKAHSFSWDITGDVPRSRGLGSSVTVRLGILHALNALNGNTLSAETLYHLCSALEGHPDNAAPAAYGGFTVSRTDFTCQRTAVSGRLSFVLLIPPFEISTSAARKILPKAVSFKHAVANVGNAALITASFMGKRYETLRDSFADHLHQPYRKKLLPGLEKIIHAGTQAGALGGWLSGSGSTIACVTLANPQKVGAAMLRASSIKAAEIHIVKADNKGAKILTRN